MGQIFDLFRAPLPNNEFIDFPVWNRLMKKTEIEEIRNFYDKYIERKRDLDYSFINSPKSPYYIADFVPIEAKAMMYFLYSEWIEEIIKEANAPKFNINHLNQECFELLYYFNEEFEISKKPIIRYTYIYHYLKRMNDERYFFEMTHENFKKFILDSFSIDVKSAKMNLPENHSVNFRKLDFLKTEFQRKSE